MFAYGVMPPLMFLGMICFMLYGFPVAFSLAAVGLFFGILGVFTGHFEEVFLQALPFRIFGIVSNDLLLAIPFFTFMGSILERCGLAEDLLEGTGKLFGAIPGGLAYAVIVVGAILGAITGTVAASVITMGVISLPIMLKYGYNPRLATGVIAASGTITQVIPPSLVLIVLADQLGRSVGDMYLGAIGPSILQVTIFLLFILALSIFRPKDVPALPPEARGEMNAALVIRVLWGMIPSIVLIFIVLGTLFLGLATPTEAGALGVVGAMGIAAMHRRLTWDLTKQGMQTTMRITSMVVFILIGATCFSLVFQGMNGGLWVEHLLSHVPGGALGFLIFVNIFIFFLAFFLDFFEIAFIVIPMLVPVANALGIDLIWFGVLICINMQTSFMHPPFGFALFYLRSIAPKSVKTKDIYLGAIPWLCMQLILVAIVIFWPESVTYWLEKAPVVDLDSIKIEIPGFGNGGGTGGMPNFGLPPMDGAPAQQGGLPGTPNLGEPPKINP
ncbi:tripartite ATP-independent transporter DctM subunit [Neorhizobium huautlense]|uniref:TRAP transporter large permease protein n=1 Tax=Neorhizobium huautlense TaxID=67774 RepID=A0ABT9PPH8_9HYPH|nr:TRAP transporter large permease subunit [Neorhizobium huautlense]MDP9836091.1 tripartite ATP-independent transporter DctM subunit [Neorhizobium huautlense]